MPRLYAPVLETRVATSWGGEGLDGAQPTLERELDAQAEVYVLLVAGVGVEVVGSAAVELVALAELASDEEAESHGAEAGGDPADGLDEGGFFRLLVVFGLAGKGEDAGRGGVLGYGVVSRRCGTKLHVYG